MQCCLHVCIIKGFLHLNFYLGVTDLGSNGIGRSREQPAAVDSAVSKGSSCKQMILKGRGRGGG